MNLAYRFMRAGMSVGAGAFFTVMHGKFAAYIGMGGWLNGFSTGIGAVTVIALVSLAIDDARRRALRRPMETVGGSSTSEILSGPGGRLTVVHVGNPDCPHRWTQWTKLRDDEEVRTCIICAREERINVL